MPDFNTIDTQYNNLATRSFSSVVFKVGSTYYARKWNGDLISASTTLDTVLSAACALKGSILLTGHDASAPSTMQLSGSFAGIDLVADTSITIDKSCNLFVPNGYTGFVFRDHDQGYLSIILNGQLNEAGTPARNWTFFKLQSDGASGCINTLLSGYGGQINNAGTGVELNCTNPGFINGNTFENLFIDGTVICFKFVGAANAPIHHNTFQNITMEGELGGSLRTGFKDICGERNLFLKCDTNDFAATDASFNFTSISRGNTVESCSLDLGSFIDLGTQNLTINCRYAGDTTSQTLSSIMTRPDFVKFGSWFGRSATVADGLLNGGLANVTVGTGALVAIAAPDSTGNYRTYDSGATNNSLIGLYGNVTTMTRISNAYFKSAVYLNNNANMRVFAGLVASTAAPASAADPLNALEGVGLWFDSGVSANWKRMHNDNAGASVVDDTSLAAATATLYPVEIYAVTDSKFRFIFNGTATDISTDIPASTTGLSFRVYLENTTGASRTMRHYYTVVRNDK